MTHLLCLSRWTLIIKQTGFDVMSSFTLFFCSVNVTPFWALSQEDSLVVMLWVWVLFAVCYSMNGCSRTPCACLCAGTVPASIRRTLWRWRLFSTRPHRSFTKSTSPTTLMRWDRPAYANEPFNIQRACLFEIQRWHWYTELQQRTFYECIYFVRTKKLEITWN